MISVSSLTKCYRKVDAIRGLTFSVEKGEIVGFLGPNGAGKTTTMRIITCYMPPTRGKVTVDGLSIFKDKQTIQRMIGYLPENNPLYLHMTVIDYLKFIAEIRLIPEKDIKSKLRRVIDLCRLKSVLYHRIEELSKGFKQRVGLAQALVHEPKLLILDEPLVGLDPRQIIEIRKLLKHLQKSTTIIICSHILSEISATCSRVFILKKGKIIADGTPDQLAQKSMIAKQMSLEVNTSKEHFLSILDPIAKDIISCTKVRQNENFTHFTISSMKDLRIQIFKAVVRNGLMLKELFIKENTLEDIFLNLTRDSS